MLRALATSPSISDFVSYDARSCVFDDPIGALAHLQIGRGLAIPGDEIRQVLPAYQDFFTLWKEGGRPRVQ